MRKTGELITEIAKGSHRAFDKLYLRYAPVVEKFALSILGSREDAADIAQSVFMKIWERRALLPGIESFESWLFTLTRNAVLNFLKKRRPSLLDDPESVFTAVNGHTPEETAVLRDEIALARAVVEAQPDQRMRVFIMSRVLGMSHKEIAEELGISPKTVENHIGRVLQELKSRLPSRYS